MPDASNQIHVMLVDDSAVIRGALTKLLETNPIMKVVKSVADGKAAIEAVEAKRPHVVILDIEMPVMDGITALPQILKASPETKVIMFSSLTEKGASITLEALKLGAVECIVKPSSAQEVGEGFVNLPTSRGTYALVEFSMKLGIELEEVQPLHVQPLMYKAGNELIGTRIVQQAAHLLAQSCGFVQGVLFSEGE